jgi:hypothetical protein
MYNKNSIVIYVLQLESNKYYIGKTTKISESFDFETILQILPTKTENTWYNMYKPIKLIEYTVCTGLQAQCNGTDVTSIPRLPFSLAAPAKREQKGVGLEFNVDGISNATPFDMIKYILSYMAKYGIDNVRGGCFSDIILSYTDYTVLSKMIRDSYNHCLYCNSEQHTYMECQYITNTLAKNTLNDNNKNKKGQNMSNMGNYEKECSDTEDFTIITTTDSVQFI